MSEPGSVPAIRNATALAARAISTVRPRWIVPAANMCSWRTTAARPGRSAAWAANSSGVPRRRATTAAISPPGGAEALWRNRWQGETSPSGRVSSADTDCQTGYGTGMDRQATPHARRLCRTACRRSRTASGRQPTGRLGRAGRASRSPRERNGRRARAISEAAADAVHAWPRSWRGTRRRAPTAPGRAAGTLRTRRRARATRGGRRCCPYGPRPLR